jgi:hypothetical protein
MGYPLAAPPGLNTLHPLAARDPTAVYFLFDKASHWNLNPVNLIFGAALSSKRVPRQDSRRMPALDKKRAACCVSRREPVVSGQFSVVSSLADHSPGPNLTTEHCSLTTMQ